MREYTMEELLEWYEEALTDYETAMVDQMFDDEEHDGIEELRHELEDLQEEIKRRKGEQE